MKIATVIGARPQFIKAAMVSRAIRAYNQSLPFVRGGKGGVDHEIHEIIIHTGQHYDYQLSQAFFDQLDLPEPNYHLDVGSGSHGDQAGRMLTGVEKVLLDEKPDVVLVHGDTNSTLAGALAAVKLHIPVGHVEGGMRSFNRKMPEEINRVLTDHIATWHFCPTETAVNNLKNEGITEGVHLVGDVMYDALILYKDIAREKSTILNELQLETLPAKRDTQGTLNVAGLSRVACKYALATVHRPENTDDPARLRNILEALVEISEEMPVVLPLHPRTRKAIDAAGCMDVILSRQAACLPAGRKSPADTKDVAGFAGGAGLAGVKIIDPVPYLDMLQLESNASIILTDSGGMQKEAFWLGVPCVTMRDETEWIETVGAGMNKIVGADKLAIISAVKEQVGTPVNCTEHHAQANKPASQALLRVLASSV